MKLRGLSIAVHCQSKGEMKGTALCNEKHMQSQSRNGPHGFVFNPSPSAHNLTIKVHLTHGLKRISPRIHRTYFLFVVLLGTSCRPFTRGQAQERCNPKALRLTR